MNAYKAHLMNACTFLIMGAWGYFATQSPTALIPVVIGVVLLSITNGVKNENKAIAHVAVVITLLALIAIVMKPLMSALDSDDIMKKFRAIAMVFTSALAMIFFIKSFIDAKKARKAKEQA